MYVEVETMVVACLNALSGFRKKPWTTSGELASCPKILTGYLMNSSQAVTAVPTCSSSSELFPSWCIKYLATSSIEQTPACQSSTLPERKTFVCVCTPASLASVGIPAIMNECLHGFPQSLQASTGIISSNGKRPPSSKFLPTHNLWSHSYLIPRYVGLTSPAESAP
jgi:hypothetical protein